MHRFRVAGRYARLTAIVPFVVLIAFLARQDGSSASQLAVAQSSLRGNPLVVPSGGLLFEGQQAAALVTARLNPQAVFARDLSRRAYAKLGREGIVRLLTASFPQTVTRQAGALGVVPPGVRMRGYAGTHALAVTLPGNRPGIVESTQPLAAHTHGRLSPIDLSLKPTASGYTPTNSDVSVRIPNRLATGVSIAGDGVTLTPVDAHGRALRSSGSILHSTIVYPNVQPGTDSVVKPTADGFQFDAVLRSAASPQLMRYRVSGPAGSRLVLDSRTGVARVILRRVTIATILPPGAIDAAGTSVPASMTVTGNTLVVSVPHRAGSYLYPIEVDPETIDNELKEIHNKGNWEFKSSNEASFGHRAVYEGGKGRLETYGQAPYGETEFGYWAYETKGTSQIYEVKVKTSAKNIGNHIESYLELEHSKTLENRVALSNESLEPEYTEKPSVICPLNSKGELNCSAGAAAANKNAVRFEQQASKSSGSSYGFSDVMTEGVVSVSEPSGEHSTTRFNTSSPEIEVEVEEEEKIVHQKRTNVLYGSKSWLSKFQGAVQLIANDTGIGVATTRLEYEKTPGVWEDLFEHKYRGEEPYLKENLCQGVQCYSEHVEGWTVNPRLPDGEDKVRYRAEEAMPETVSPAGEPASTQTVKVDTKAPHDVTLHGLPYGNELSEKPYTLSVTAIDGEGATIASSGVKKITLFVGGEEVAELGTQTGCTVAQGECTAKAEWEINGAELGAGHHAIVIVATDNAGNESRLEETISIRHSTPVALGPGSVDLESGDYSLASTDVSMGSGLTVGRSYSSRATAAGEEGPLGPQWSLNLGTSESLVEMVDESVLLTSSEGKQSIFASLGEGKFESPTGDANLTLELEENKTTKEKLAYYLKNSAAGTSDKFTLPSGSKEWVPTRQEGTTGTDTVTYEYKSVEHKAEFPVPSSGAELRGITSGPDGNLWFTDKHNNKVGKMSTSGIVLAEYATYEKPTSIVTSSGGALWVIAGEGQRIVKLTTSGSQTEYHLLSGSNATGIAPGPEGSIWITEAGTKKIGVINKFGGGPIEYPVPKGTPHGIAEGPEGNMWFVTSSPSKVDMIKSGVVTEHSLPSETTSTESIALGPDKNLWFGETGKIAKMTPSGTYTVTEYPLPSGATPAAVSAGPDKNVWFTDPGGKGLGKVNGEGVITEFSSGSAYSLVTGSDGNIWYPINSGGVIARSTTSGRITEPTEILAPVPSKVSCSPEMKPGCRALKFSYESSNQLLKKVSLTAYNPASGKMEDAAVAEYSYDPQGKLTAEWDPRYGTKKTSYGYDLEGHVTALSPPGEGTWAFVYGTIPGDTGTGRLLKVVRGSSVWTGEGIKNILRPEVTGAPYVGVRMTVSDGNWWPGIPVAYGYQWEDCNTGGVECTPIPGANNANYTPVATDVGHTLVAVVAATNGSGSVTASSEATGKVTSQAPEYSLPAESGPYGITARIDGYLWFVDRNSNKISKMTASGEITEYALPAGSKPVSVARGPDDQLWFTEALTNKIGKITTSGTIKEYALPVKSKPTSIAAGPDGNMWFTELGTNKIGKITTAGTVTEYPLSGAYIPEGITAGSDGNMWFTNYISRIGKITTSGAITEYSPPTEGFLTGIASGPDGNLWFLDSNAHKVGKVTTSGSFTEYSLPAGSEPEGITVAADNNLWFTDYGTNKIGRITTSGSITEYSLPAGSKPYGITPGPDGNVWFTNYGTNKVSNVGLDGAVRTPSAGWTMEYNVPLAGGSGLPAMTSGEVAKWGQTDVPVEATAIVPPDAKQDWPASSYARATSYYLDSQGRTVNASRPSIASHGSVTTTEYNETNDVARTLSADNRQTALEAGSESADTAKLLATYYTYREECSKESENKHEAEGDPGARLCETEGPQHEIKYMTGGEQKEELGRLHTKYFYDENSPGGETYNLATKTSTLAELNNEEEVEVRKTTTSYSGQSELGWKLRAPTSVTIDPEGKKLTTTTLYNSTTGQITETRAPAGPGGGSAHDTKFIYYTADANTEGYPVCGGHPEWAGLLCETLPAKQPESGGLPQLPVTVVTSYNVWNEPLTVTETFGSTVRTKTKTYDAAGRLLTSETTSSAGTSLPKVTNAYNTVTGVLEKQSTTVESKTTAVTSKYNTLGQLTEYTDADGNIVKYRYAGSENDWLLEEMTDGSNAGTGKQTYTYNATSKAREELWDSAAGTFTASYDAEGKMTSEVYPNAMCANYAYNATGEATHIEYVKTTNCSESGTPVWFSETRDPAVRGETLGRSNTLASDAYMYDSVGRLTEARETPTGEGCSTRLYAYDEEANRTSQTTRAPGSGGKCATEGGTVLNHTYDEGNRLTDSGIAYDSFGNVTKLPAADAEGHELSSTFYVDNAVATQSQNGVTNNYYLDPTGRVRETVSGANATVTHYDGPGESLAWTSESEGKSTRNIPGIDRTLSATQTNGATPVLQLHDLQGDVVATAALSTTETKLLSTYNSTEFGVPNAEKTPPKYAWLGAVDVASAFSSGVITYGATSYVPQTGRALQSQAVEPPGAPNGTGGGAAYTSQEEPWVFQGAAAAAAEAPGREAAREREAAEAAFEAAMYGGSDPIFYFNRKKAEEKALELENIGAIGEVINFAFDGLPKTLEDAAEAALKEIGLNVVFDWFKESAELLRKCAANKRGADVSICRFSYTEKELLGVKFVALAVPPEVRECLHWGVPGTGGLGPCLWRVYV